MMWKKTGNPKRSGREPNLGSGSQQQQQAEYSQYEQRTYHHGDRILPGPGIFQHVVIVVLLDATPKA
jgi:hypothetical protein